MQIDEYCSLLIQRLHRYFNLLPDGIFNGKKYEIAAIYNVRENQTVLFKENVMDYLDSKEICLVSTGCTAEFIRRELTDIPVLAFSQIQPSRHHKSTIFTRIFVVAEADREMIRLVRRFHFSQSFRFSLWGWTEGRAILVDTGNNKVFVNRAARMHKKIFIPVQNGNKS